MTCIRVTSFVGALGAVLGLAASAHAYPQFQLSTGATRCNQCHFAPAGGGLLNNYGRDEAGDTISGGGDGSFLHGLWTPPAWLALGGDYRGAALINDVGATDGAELAVFPMQADLYTRAEVHGVSFTLIAGLRGAARPDAPEPISRVASREHYLMWQPKAQGPYARVGRFFVPMGLRLAEHPAFVRRFLSFGPLEETYAVSGGYIRNDWEVHGSVFVPDFLRPVGQRGRGAAVFYERRERGGALAWGGQARASFADIDDRYTLGVLGKYYLEAPRLLFMAELDFVRQAIHPVDTANFPGAGRNQLASYASATWFWRRGLMFTGGWERYDEDLAVKNVARDAAIVQAHWFFSAHFEALLYGRYQILGAGDGGDPSRVAMLQLHYYL